MELSFDQQAMPDLSKEDLDLEQISRAFGKEVSEEKLRSLGILTPFAHRLVPSVGGMILFGKKERPFPDVRIRCARFLGNTKERILDQCEIEGNGVDEILKFIARNTRLTAEIVEIRRRDIPQYPPLALREALINAIAHADYSLKGMDIQVAIFNNRLEIQNPGMLPFGFTLEDFKSGVSRIRNRVITRVFHELRLMEQWGSGYKRILETCHEGGYPEPQWEELGIAIRVTFYPHSCTLLFEEERSPYYPSLKDLMPREEMILKLFEQGKKLPFREIFAQLPFPISERTLRYDLTHLKKKGLVTSKGKGRATIWQKIPSEK